MEMRHVKIVSKNVSNKNECITLQFTIELSLKLIEQVSESGTNLLLKLLITFKAFIPQ